MKSIPRTKVGLNFCMFAAKAVNFQKVISINMLWCIFWWSLDVDDNLCSEHGNRLLKTRARTEAAYCVLTIICFRWTFLPTMKTNAISPSGACWSNHCSSQSQNPKPIVSHVIPRLGGSFKLKWKLMWQDPVSTMQKTGWTNHSSFLLRSLIHRMVCKRVTLWMWSLGGS